MSNLEEKLEHFKAVIMQEAAVKRQKILDQAADEKEKAMSQARKTYEHEANEYYRKQLEAIKKEKNDSISKAILDGKLLLMKTREGIIQQVFQEVNHKLSDFVNTEGYEAYLAESIRHTCSLAGPGSLVVSVSRRDLERQALLEELKRTVPGIRAFEQADEDILGGCRVLNETTRIYIDHSLSRQIALERERFLDESRLRID